MILCNVKEYNYPIQVTAGMSIAFVVILKEISQDFI